MYDKQERIKNSMNWKLGVDNFGEDEEMFIGMVGRFESLTMNEGLKKMYESALQKDWKEFRHQAHTLKGSSAYNFTFRTNFR